MRPGGIVLASESATDRLRPQTKIDSRHPSAEKSDAGTVPWRLNGELILNCNCTVFCPCVVSLGQHSPTEGYCQAWAGIRIDEGAYGTEDLSGLNIGLVMEIPGLMARGNWKVAAYIDERASHKGFHGIVQILSGKAKGTTGLVQCPCQRIPRCRPGRSDLRKRGKDSPFEGWQEDRRRGCACRWLRSGFGYCRNQHEILDGSRCDRRDRQQRSGAGSWSCLGF